MLKREGSRTRRSAGLDPMISEMITKSVRLTDDEQERLLTAVAAGRMPRASKKKKVAAKEAEGSLVECMMRYATKVAFAHRPSRLEADDAFAEAMAAIVDVLKEWYPARGGASAFRALIGYRCVLRLAYARETSGVIRIPRGQDYRISKGIASDATLEAVRRGRSLGSLAEFDPSDDYKEVETDSRPDEIRDGVIEALAGLSVAEQRIIRSRYGIGRRAASAKEMSARRGISISAVENRLHRTRKKLRAALVHLAEPGQSL